MPEDVSEYLTNVRFRRRLFGGVDEYDVWKKLRKVAEMYSKKLEDQKTEAAALLKDREKHLAAQIQLCHKYKEMLQKNGIDYD